MGKINRREFLGQASCAAVGSASVLSTLLSLRMAGTAAAVTAPGNDDYRALVCVFLAGGNDSFNMLVPHGQDEYDDYADVRRDLALPRNSLLPINFTASDGRTFSVHPSMPGVQSMFDNHDLSFVCNVGTLVEPTTLSAMQAGLVKLPKGLFSHSDQQMHWQSSMPDNGAPLTGWGGRTADLLNSLNQDSAVSMNISLSGTNLFQRGNSVIPYSIGSGGSTELTDAGWSNRPQRWTAWNSMMDREYSNLFEKTFAQKSKDMVAAHEYFSTSIASGTPITTAFSGNSFSKKLEMVAKTIAAHNALGVKRQTFFVQFGGWDLHGELLAPHAGLLQVLGQGLSEFNAAMKEIQMHDSVTTFTASDFARTLTTNGGGSDHAWGGNVMVMGGQVDGGKVFGDYPDMAAGDLDVGRGRYIPSTSVDSYLSELALWLGVSKQNLPIAFPNIGRFYDTTSQDPPVGFML